MEMSSRYSLSDPDILGRDYRFRFNGMEKDEEITGQTGSHYTAMFWEYDARIGRRWNIDVDGTDIQFQVMKLLMHILDRF